MRRGQPAATGGQQVAAVETRSNWSNLQHALAVVAYRPHFRRRIRAALLVGTVLFSINQLDVILRHQATDATWLIGALTYRVPFCVANYGILAASKPTGE